MARPGRPRPKGRRAAKVWQKGAPRFFQLQTFFFPLINRRNGVSTIKFQLHCRLFLLATRDDSCADPSSKPPSSHSKRIWLKRKKDPTWRPVPWPVWLPRRPR